MRTFILKERDDKTVRAVSLGPDVSAAVRPGTKLYEVAPADPAPTIEFTIPHVYVCMDGTRDDAAVRFYVPDEDLDEA